MWEHRIDNKKKLKYNAVPTIFGYYIKQKTLVNNKKSDINEEEHRSVNEEDQIIINDKQVKKNK